jgi:hypothetical protein
MTTTSDDHPLPTQTAAPPVVPPKRPNVSAAMADDDGQTRFQELDNRLQAAEQATRAALARLARVIEWEERKRPTDPTDA